jgi:hypothetical protein
MNFSIGVIITIAAVVLFYLRLGQLQLGKARRAKEYEEGVKQNKGKKGSKKSQENPPPGKYSIEVRSIPWVVISIVLVVFGVLINSDPAILPSAKDFWWVAVVAGIIIMGINFK